jgi:hypothetical protein
MRDEKDQEVYKKVADSNHPKAQQTWVASIYIGIAVGNQQEHGGRFQQRENTPAPVRKGLGHQGQHHEYAANTAHVQHDIQLMGFQKIKQRFSLLPPGRFSVFVAGAVFLTYFSTE